MDAFIFTLTLVSALVCGLVGGVFFAFSVFVMKALGRLPPARGIAAMQSINITVITPLFMLTLFGTALTCLALAGLAPFRWSEPEAPYLLAGGLLYLIGSVLVTIACNVPRNDALAAVDAESETGADVWTGYLSIWVAWNHVRTVAALAAAALFTVALASG